MHKKSLVYNHAQSSALTILMIVANDTGAYGFVEKLTEMAYRLMLIDILMAC